MMRPPLAWPHPEKSAAATRHLIGARQPLLFEQGLGDDWCFALLDLPESQFDGLLAGGKVGDDNDLRPD
jgi:hypothetical protein